MEKKINSYIIAGSINTKDGRTLKDYTTEVLSYKTTETNQRNIWNDCDTFIEESDDYFVMECKYPDDVEVHIDSIELYDPKNKKLIPIDDVDEDIPVI